MNIQTTRLLKKGPECFEYLSMNGNIDDINSLPFVLSSVEGLRVFQEPAHGH
jgi:hypothetical protein